MDKQAYKELIAEYIRREAELKMKLEEVTQKVKDLETELYFCRRNRKIEDEIQKGKSLEE
jgi:type III secretory pathway component EscU